MSEENVELVRQMYELFRSVDLKADGVIEDGEQLAVAAGIFHPDFELDTTRAPMPDLRGKFRGLAEVVNFWRQWLEAWESVEFEDELTDAGDYVFAAITPMAMRGKGSGIAVEFPPHWQVFTLREGKVIRQTFFLEEAEALEAAGLSE
jgi:ketosteroid isomerase-like protein